MTTNESLENQSNEFHALCELIAKYNNLPAVVDDGYPEARHYYESALKTFIDALRKNRRI
jgi:hypothetical protein